jgi:hypothetical protein
MAPDYKTAHMLYTSLARDAVKKPEDADKLLLIDILRSKQL